MNESTRNKDIYQNEDAVILEDLEQDLEKTLDLEKELETYKELNQGENDE